METRIGKMQKYSPILFEKLKALCFVQKMEFCVRKSRNYNYLFWSI